MIRFLVPLPALMTLAAWLAVGIVYLWQIQKFGSRTFLRRMPNYRHFSHVLIVCQIAGMLAGAGQLSVGKPLSWVVFSLGLAFGAGGFVLCLWAKQELGRFWDRHASIQVDHHLVRTGPYAWCRNPIFLGQFGLFIGAGLASLNAVALICCAPALWSFYRRLRTEEMLLAAHFGRDYEGYRAEVPRFWPVTMRRRALMPIIPELLETSQKI